MIDAECDWQYVKIEFNATKSNGSSNTTKLNSSSTIKTPNSVIVGNEINITGVATDENGDPIANTELSVTVDGKTYTVTTDSNGHWILVYKPTRTGNIATSVSWTGNSTHNGFTNSTNFNVLKRNIIVILTVTENPDGSITIIANATYEDDRSPANDYPVEFLLDGKVVGNGITDENGIATLIIPSNRINDGLHIITVIVIGGEQANNATASLEFTRTTENNDTDDDTNDDVNDDLNKDTDKTNNNPAATAAMKKTGIPITTILLALLSCFGLIYRKKQNLNNNFREY